MSKVKKLKVKHNTIMVVSFNIDVPKETRQDVADRFYKTSGIPVIVVDKQADITFVEKDAWKKTRKRNEKNINNLYCIFNGISTRLW